MTAFKASTCKKQ